MVSSTVKSLYTTIYDQAHSQAHGLLIAGNNEGKILVYDVSGLLQREEGGGVKGERPLAPLCAVTVSSNPVYCLTHTPAFAVAGTTGAITGWRWKDLEQNSSTSPAWGITLDCDQTNFGPPEVNRLSYDTENGTVWAACGDWKTRSYDLETGKLVTSLEGHKDYVHQVTARGSTVLTCGEDGAVLVWDSRASRQPRTSLVPGLEPQLARPHLGKHIVSVDYAGGEWLVCGGGPRAAVYHLRSAGLVTALPPTDANTAVTVTKFTRPGDAASIVTAGSDGGCVTVCSLSGQVTAKLPTSARCVYSVQASFDKHTLMSIGGCSNKIDLCLNLSYRDHSVTTVAV